MVQDHSVRGLVRRRKRGDSLKREREVIRRREI